MGYNVDTRLEIKDNATRALNQLIGVIERTDTAAKGLQSTLAGITHNLTLLEATARTARSAFGQLTGGFTQFERGIMAGSRRMATFGAETRASTTNLQTMTRNLDRVEIQANQTTGALTRMARAGRTAGGGGGFFGFGGGGRGGRGGGGHGGGGHGGGFGGAAGEFFSGAAMMGMPMYGGGIAATAGMGAAALLGATVAQGIKAQHAERLLKLAGNFNPQQMQQATQLAQQITKDVPTSTFKGNMENIKEMYGVFGDFKKALGAAKQGTKWQALLESLGDDIPSMHEDKGGLLQTIFKSAEKLGATEPKQVEKIASGIIRSYISSGGLSKPETFNQTLTMMRSSRYGKSEDFLMGVVPFFISEYSRGKMGGGSQGIGPMFSQMDQLFAKGRMTHPMAEQMAKMGLFQDVQVGKDMKGKTVLVDQKTKQLIKMDTATISTLVSSKLTNEAGFVDNPFKWVTTTYKDAMLKTAFPKLDKEAREKTWDTMDQAKRTVLINSQTPGMNKTAQDPLMNMLINQELIQRHINTFHQVPELRELENKAMEDTGMKLKAVTTQFENLITQLGRMPQVMNPVNQALNSMLKLMSGLNMDLTHVNTAWPATSAGIKRFSVDMDGFGQSMGNAWVQFKPWFDLLIGSSLVAAGGAVGYANNVLSTPGKIWKEVGDAANDVASLINGGKKGKASSNPASKGGVTKFHLPPAPDTPFWGGAAPYSSAPPGHTLVAPPPPTAPSPNALAAMQKLGAPAGQTFVFNQHGPVFGMPHLKSFIEDSLAQAHTKAGMKHQATAAPAGGVYNNPSLSGSN